MKNIKRFTWPIIIGLVIASSILIGNYLLGVSTWVESNVLTFHFMSLWSY